MYIESILENPYFLVPLVLWSSTWKGLGLWRAAMRKDKLFFITIFILNTVGIIPILYLIFTNKRKHKKED